MNTRHLDIVVTTAVARIASQVVRTQVPPVSLPHAAPN